MDTNISNIEQAYQELLQKAENQDNAIESIIGLESNDITKENANVSAETINGQLFRIWSETSKQFAIDHLLSPEVLKYKNENKLYIHDLDFYPLKTLTCIQSPYDKIFENGFTLGPNYLRAPKRIETAVTLSTRCGHTTQSVQHGGQSAPAFDFYMAPYVRLTFKEEIKKAEQLTGEDYSDLYDIEIKDYITKDIEGLKGKERILQNAINNTVNRVHQSMESLIAEYSTSNIRVGGQPTFISLNYGTDTSAEGRCVIRELLQATYEGVGNGQTAIFPIQIMKIKAGVNYRPEDPNYDLYQFACEVTAKRFFPNFLNLDATFNQHELWKADDPKRYEYEVATMGCVDGKSKVMVLARENMLLNSNIENIWNYFAENSEVHSQTEEGFEGGEFIDLENVQIFDNGKFVDCLRIIKNPDKGDWYKVTLDDGKQLICTSDHPWSVNTENGLVVKATETLEIGDVITVINNDIPGTSEVGMIEFIGPRNEFSYDVTTASEHFTVNDIRSHNCRTRVFENRFGPKTSVGRGNISFSTINIVRLAIECMNIENKEERIKTFFDKLAEVMDVAAKQLDERFQYQKTALAKQFPLLMNGAWIGSENLKPDDTVESVINQGTLGIGFIGLAECLIALIGKHHGESEEAQELGLKIVTFMRDKANDFCEQYKHNYSVLATPAEGLSGKFTKVDKKEFGIIPGVTDKDYYTNSNHVPVYYKISALKKAKIEAPYHDLTRGGHIFYVEVDGDATHNPDVVMKIVDLMHDFNMGYGSINHNRNRCLDCGYEDATKGLKVCPKCGSTNLDTIQRITGYLTSTVSKWNFAKRSELKDRVTHVNKNDE